ncbi:TPA: GNAT family N-acetyltransferase [Legionella pneumophila]|nr:GNAT family N-acetyltransferase [Legionella pneumophila]HAT8181811.1 GNAT family N-acetyltransferase [Legionella pneumophila]
MNEVIIREVTSEDKEIFLCAMQSSQVLHHPWVKAPLTLAEFDEYFSRYQKPNQKSYLVLHANDIAGVFNISEIVRGYFQNAYLGFYAVADYAGKGYMSTGLKLILAKVFKEMGLHRIEANIQPENIRSIWLVKQNGFRYEGFSPRYLKVDGVWQGHEHWAITYEDFIKDDCDVLEKDHIDIVAYNREWPLLAKIEMAKLQASFPANSVIDIQHVGSTAIPGMASKPIIDIQIAVSSLEEMKSIAVPILQKLGYEYWEDNPDPERMFFVKGMPPYGNGRTHHVHIVETLSRHWKGKILFRDYLLSHSEAAEEYQQLKIKLAQEHKYDREQYTDAKSEFINQILKLAQN